MNFPLPEFIAVSAANPWTYVLFAAIGFAFGYTLEMSGFGDSRKLAAQFYFTELTVLKVMFTAIAVAMVLLFGSVSLGILDFSQVWVNPPPHWLPHPQEKLMACYSCSAALSARSCSVKPKSISTAGTPTQATTDD